MIPGKDNWLLDGSLRSKFVEILGTSTSIHPHMFDHYFQNKMAAPLATAVAAFYGLTCKTLKGAPFEFNSLKGKVVLVVNVASQYAMNRGYYMYTSWFILIWICWNLCVRKSLSNCTTARVRAIFCFFRFFSNILCSTNVNAKYVASTNHPSLQSNQTP